MTDLLDPEVRAGVARAPYRGNFVRWVRDRHDQAAAAAFFKQDCDRVRVMPFLDGVPRSIHGFVLPDGTAALRPVEIVILRNTDQRTFVYAGLGTTWDPPAAPVNAALLAFVDGEYGTGFGTLEPAPDLRTG